MTGKEKIKEVKQDKGGKTKQKGKPEPKPVVETEDKEKKKMSEELKALEEKTREMHDKYLRLSAEFDNYRKRTLREKSEMIKTASEDLIIRIIPIVDDIERGLNAISTAQDMEALKQGMNLIYGRFNDFLQQNGVKEIDALHQEFNTDLHEAVTKIPASEDGLKGKVVDVVQKGYLLHDKVIRYPKVVVGQ
jgi:molecular chaperone GrpE